MGRILGGDAERLRAAAADFVAQPIDEERMEPVKTGETDRQTTLRKPIAVSGPGTFFGKANRTLEFCPSGQMGWRFDRTDLPRSMGILVTVENVWTTVRNIVLCSGSPHNYMRMVEHIVALKFLGLDNVLIRMDSGDPPLFNVGSMDLVEGIDAAGIVPQQDKAPVVTVKETVSLVAPHGGFLVFHPAKKGNRRLTVDCGVNFKTAIGRQRIRFDVNPTTVRYGAAARTNTTLGMMLYCKTLGKLFADTRHLGYTTRNILIAGPWHYFNKPQFMHNGKSLEAVWHRAVLDLLAAVALIDRGRFAGHIDSYMAGHALDVDMVRLLYQHDLLEDVQ